jgi:very-short-patch-repair endonuclease
MLWVGVLPSGISDRVTAGRLHRIHRGVYAAGHPNIGNEGRWMAAVLACGDDAVLSHRSAAALWRVLPQGRGVPAAGTSGSSREGVIEVTVPGSGGRAIRSGIKVHRSQTLQPGDRTIRDGIPVTNPMRTLEDLRRTLPREKFAAALRQAEFLRLPIGDRLSPDRTRSELEARFLAVCRRHRLPQPEVNVRVDRFLVDFLWRAQRLIVELDGWESHRTRSAFEEDRARDARLKVLGYEVLRFTWRQVENDAVGMARSVRALIRGAE